MKINGKAAVVIPTGFITSKSGVERRILERVVNDHLVYGCVSMPSNVFATTGTNVSVIFFEKKEKQDSDKVILIDASKLGEDYKEGNNKKTKLRPFEVDKIVNAFQNKENIDDFSVAVTYNEIKEKNYSLSAGQYFDIKIDYVDITEEEFNQRMNNFKAELSKQFDESHRLEEEIMKQLNSLKFNPDIDKK
jgi:type I restriction enzyme M protein